MLKSMSVIAIISLLYSYSVNAQTTANGHINNNTIATQIERVGNIPTYANYLGLTLPQYGKFHAAISARTQAVTAGPGFELKKHPAYIQVIQMLENNNDVPEALEAEMFATFKEYNAGMARYVGISVERYEATVKKFTDLEVILNGLSKARFNPTDIDSPSTKSTNEEDEVEVIEIRATEQKIEQTSSGGFTSLIFAIQAAGASYMPSYQVTGTFTVRFISTNSSLQGTQEFRVTQTYAWPVSTFTCDSENCALNPQ